MKKSYIIILTLLVCIVLIACKNNQNSNISQNDNLPNNENELVEDNIESKVMDEDGGYDFTESSFADNMDVDEFIDIDDEHTNDTIEEVITPVHATGNPKIIVKKSDRTLELWDDDNLSASYPIGLGWDPVGDKQKEGDGKTPEGVYYVCTRNNYSRFYLSLGLSYPNKEDAYEALESGLIDQSTYNQIEDAINREVQPPWNTALGGEIMIHGHGSHSDWTAGCVAVDDDIMDILWDNCPMGTQVIIEP